jgi:hypothetical protein
LHGFAAGGAERFGLGADIAPFRARFDPRARRLPGAPTGLQLLARPAGEIAPLRGAVTGGDSFRFFLRRHGRRHGRGWHTGAEQQQRHQQQITHDHSTANCMKDRQAGMCMQACIAIVAEMIRRLTGMDRIRRLLFL